MANTYSQIYIQFIFAVKSRESQILESHRERLQQYITGIIRSKEQKLLAIYANPDHIHLLVGFNKLDIKISDFVKEIKSNSSKKINEENWFIGKFHWQEGYGAFSYAHSQLDNVYHYIENQEEHHRKKTFREEYIDFLRKFEVDYDEKYLFDWLE